METLGNAEYEGLTRSILAEPDINGAAYLLALNLGLRLGEVCGLKWSDINFAERLLYVNRTAIKLMEGTLFLVLTDAPRPTRKELRRTNLPLSPDTLPPAGASGDGKGNALCQRRFAYRNRMYSKGILSLTIL